MANELLMGRLSGRGSDVGGARRTSGRARTRGRGGPCAPVRESRCDREPVRPGRPNPHRHGARAGRATSGARSVAAVPLPAPSASGRSAEGVGRAPQSPPAALPQPGKNVPPAVLLRSRALRPGVRNLEPEETKAAVGTDALRDWGLGKQKVRKPRRGRRRWQRGNPAGSSFWE